jgi:hypothetical protein
MNRGNRGNRGNRRKDFNQLQLAINQPFSIDDPYNISKGVVLHCISLFKTTCTPSHPVRPQIVMGVMGVMKIGVSIHRICHNTDFNVRSLLPRGEGACDAFDRELNNLENDLDSDEYMY